MASPIFLPKVGMAAVEATLLRWLEHDGAEVRRGQVIFEMETENGQMEVGAEGDGFLKQLVPEGAELAPGNVVGCLLAHDEEVPQALLDQVVAQGGGVPAMSQSTAAEAEPTSPDAPKTVFEVQFPGTRASSVARRLAGEHGIDVRQMTGSGLDGRIIERDVQQAIETGHLVGPGPEVESGETTDAPLAPHSATEAPPASLPPSSASYSGQRRVIGQRMQESLSSMAQLTLTSETPVDEATKMLHGLNLEWRKEGIVVTLTALIVKASALALRDRPYLNARLDAEQGVVMLEPEVHIGVAVTQDAGLIVPVVRNADGLTLKELAAALNDQTGKVRANQPGMEDVEGATFTVTSLEESVVDAFTPIINPPQSAILGVGRTREVAAFEGGEVVKRQVTTLSLTFDHRVTDGTDAARFLERTAELLQRPYLLM